MGLVRLGVLWRLKPAATVGQYIVTVPLPVGRIVRLGIETNGGVTSAQVSPTRSSSAVVASGAVTWRKKNRPMLTISALPIMLATDAGGELEAPKVEGLGLSHKSQTSSPV